MFGRGYPFVDRPTPLLDLVKGSEDPWTATLRSRYHGLRLRYPGLYDLPASQIYVDPGFGVTKIGASRLYYTIENSTAKITDIFVVEEQRGMGVGRLLAEVTLEMMKEMGVGSVRLWSEVKDKRFWTTMGFSPGPDGVWRRSL